ncbi:response regulator transcription factor [Candidatus Epulonipiscium viviparus]|uniref:response regulator transcription factor n=1 Tax=Candidatus Epulonipiscium viviparus TaxID=420336 RepID=UPI0005C5EF3E|nr:response regulator [Candidatus Epulopiscium viviparus]
MFKVVIADDERIIRMGLKSLRWDNYNMEIVGEAKNGLEAIELIDSLKFDILISDIKMPGKTGLEIAKYLKEIKSNIKIILLSGYGEFEYAKEALALGVFDYILKPSTPAEILDTAARARDELIKESKEKEYVEEMEQKITDYQNIVGAKIAINNDKNQDIKKILEYIYSNYEKELTLQVLADQHHFTSVYLSSYIKKNTGHTFLEILTSVRMYHAAKLLKTTNLKNIDIANRVGILDSRYFSQVFKKYHGQTPNEYRKDKCIKNLSLSNYLSNIKES